MGLFELEGGGTESPPMDQRHTGGAAKAPFMVYSCTLSSIYYTIIAYLQPSIHQKRWS